MMWWWQKVFCKRFSNNITNERWKCTRNSNNDVNDKAATATKIPHAKWHGKATESGVSPTVNWFCHNTRPSCNIFIVLLLVFWSEWSWRVYTVYSTGACTCRLVYLYNVWTNYVFFISIYFGWDIQYTILGLLYSLPVQYFSMFNFKLYLWAPTLDSPSQHQSTKTFKTSPSQERGNSLHPGGERFKRLSGDQSEVSRYRPVTQIYE